MHRHFVHPKSGRLYGVLKLADAEAGTADLEELHDAKRNVMYARGSAQLHIDFMCPFPVKKSYSTVPSVLT